MKKITIPFFLLISTLFLSGFVLYGQTTTIGGGVHRTFNWTVSEPFEQQVFIENNEGQFNGKIPEENGNILFSTRITGVDIYFSPTGVTYRYDKFPEPSGYDEDDKNEKPETNFFTIQWENTNPYVELIAEDEVGFHYCYSKGNNHTTFAHAFKKILYKNLYLGIDVEYSFSAKGKGLEYSVIVQPYADLSAVKMLYKNASSISIDNFGDIHLESSFGQFKEYAPTNTYYSEDNYSIACQFNKESNEISFAAVYDKNKTLVIDPWIVNPLFTGYDAGYDLHYDLKGNTYVYGSYNPYQLIKVDSTGIIQWIYNAIFPDTNRKFGGFAVDETSGTSYLGCATNPWIIKVNTVGYQINSFKIGNTMEELWRMDYIKCLGQLVIGGGGTTSSNQVCILDTNLVTLSAKDILAAGEHQHDVALLTIDRANSSIYIAIMESNARPSFNNVLVKCTFPAITTNYVVSDGFSFYEGLPGLSFIGGINGSSGSPNGAVAGANWLYLYDGSTLNLYQKNTGIITLSQTITNTKWNWSGMDLDLCENLYLAADSNIFIYDTNLNKTGVISEGNPVYDLKIAPVNKLLVCGNHFISSKDLPSLVSLRVSVTQANACLPAKATAHVTSCIDSTLLTYLWSNGATTQTDSGLSIGNYSVIVTANCDFSFIDTFNISKGQGNLSGIVSGKNLICFQGANGTVSITSNGSAPFTYSWSPGGGTGSSQTGLSAGNYMVTVYDSCGNSMIDSIAITQPAELVAFAYLINHNICFDSLGKAAVLISGGLKPYTYFWSNGSTVSSISSLSAGTYTIVVTDSNSCTASDTIIFNSPTAINVTLTILSTIKCYNDSNAGVFVAASGGSGFYSYSWSNGSSNSIISNLKPGTYSVTATDNNGCTGTGAVFITQPAVLTDTAFSLNPSCSGQSNGEAFIGVFGGTEPYTFLWSNSSRQDSNSGLSAGLYSVVVTDSNGCTASSTIIINSVPLPSVTLIKQSKDTVCSTAGSILLFGVPPGGIINGKGIYVNYFYPDSVNLDTFNYFTYTYTDTDGCVATSTDSIYVVDCTGIPFSLGLEKINIYPNPANTYINIELYGINEESTISLINVLGQDLLDKKIEPNNNITISVSEYTSGIYLLNLQSKNGIIARKKLEIIK